jgi:hypothetical protein
LHLSTALGFVEAVSADLIFLTHDAELALAARSVNFAVEGIRALALLGHDRRYGFESSFASREPSLNKERRFPNRRSSRSPSKRRFIPFLRALLGSLVSSCDVLACAIDA